MNLKPLSIMRHSTKAVSMIGTAALGLTSRWPVVGELFDVSSRRDCMGTMYIIRMETKDSYDVGGSSGAMAYGSNVLPKCLKLIRKNLD